MRDTWTLIDQKLGAFVRGELVLIAFVAALLGGAVGLSPLLTLVSVSVVGVLLGGFYVLLSVPIASLLATVVDVTLRGIDPTDVEVPTVIFPSQDTG